MKSLIIAEKPSVAKDIAHALHVPFNNGLFENDKLVISHCLGHLISIALQDNTSTTLPIIPDKFDLVINPATKEQFNILKNLMNRPDIDTIINACDAGREGEAIFRRVYEKAQCKKTIQRMWLQSMTEQSIQIAYRDRKDGKIYDNLADAAQSRAEADWLYGINGSRLVNSPVGRVMTPTLAMIVERYHLNTTFKSIPFWRIKGSFITKEGLLYVGILEQASNTEYPDRFDKKELAQALLEKIPLGQNAIVEDITKTHTKSAPSLFHLTSLQQEANKKFGFSASKTLSIAQSLYEKHKMLSYPRTDADALPEDYIDTAKSLIQLLSKDTRYTEFAKTIEANNWVVPSKAIFNDDRISDHYAIIPTSQTAGNLSEDEDKIYSLVVKRFLAVFYPPVEYTKTTRTSTIGAYLFKSTSTTIKNYGWQIVYGKEDENKENETLPLCSTSILKHVQLEEGKTKPPALYTEATLLKAMETAGKEIEDEELQSALKDKGLGTPATRAAIIEKLKENKRGAYIVQQKNSLIPTQKGIDLIKALKERFDIITSAELTGEWEYQLKQIEKGELSKQDYMRRIHQAVYDFVSAIQKNPMNTLYQSIGKCPCCNQAELQNRKFSHYCTNCDFSLNKEVAGLTLPKSAIDALLKGGKTDKLTFKSKAGKKFDAYLSIDKAQKKLVFNFA